MYKLQSEAKASRGLKPPTFVPIGLRCPKGYPSHLKDRSGTAQRAIEQREVKFTA
jgi:hypothetical protein